MHHALPRLQQEAQISGAFSGATRTRTGDLLGAIRALHCVDLAWFSAFGESRRRSLNSFPNNVVAVLQYDSAL